MAGTKKQLDGDKMLCSLYAVYPKGLSTGEIGKTLGCHKQTARRLLLRLKSEDLASETGVTNAHINGVPANRSIDQTAVSNRNEWILTDEGENVCYETLWMDNIQNYHDVFIIGLYNMVTVDAPEHLIYLEKAGYVKKVDDGYQLTPNGIERAEYEINMLNQNDLYQSILYWI